MIQTTQTLTIPRIFENTTKAQKRSAPTGQVWHRTEAATALPQLKNIKTAQIKSTSPKTELEDQVEQMLEAQIQVDIIC